MNGIDATIVIAYLLAMVGVGVWFMRRNKSANDYFRGGGRLPWWVVSLSIYATLFSSITFLSIPALTYHSDCRYFLKTLGILVLVPVVVRFYLPFFRKLNLTSAYEYLEVRFNLGCRLFASAAFVLFMIARTAVVAYLPSVAIAAVTGIDVNLAIVIVTLITIVYCTIGGVEAVVWSDFVQSVILIGSTVAIYAYLVCGTDGGLSGFVAKGLESGKFRMLDLGWDWTQPVLWVVLVGGIVENLASYTSDQCVVQRYMTCRDEAGAAKSIRLNGVLSFANCFVFFTLGVALWTFYQSHADKIPTLAKNDQIFPWFIAHELPVGFSGLVLAAVAAATMSTLSANLNSAATAVSKDFYERLLLRNRTIEQSEQSNSLLRCGKIVTVAVGLLGGAFALVLANMDIGSIYDQFLRFLGVLTGGLACLFLMGRFMPFVNGRGAFIGLVANYVVCFSLDALNVPWKPHVLLYGFLGMAVCIPVAALASIVLKGGRAALCLMGMLAVSGTFGAVKEMPLDVVERIALWPDGKVPDFSPRQSKAVLEVVNVPNPKSDALVIVIGGGSYRQQLFVYDPAEMVAALVSNGVRCANLRHRCPRPVGKPKHLSGWQDVQRAVRVCRANAAKWKVNPNRIGVIGFSAGGHVALMAAVSSQTPAYAPIDATDKLSCAVNFAVPAYPAYVLDGHDNLTKGFTDARKGHEKDWDLPLSAELKFDRATPPVFLLHGSRDGMVPVMGTAIVYNRLLKMGVPVQMLLLADHDHGFSYGRTKGAVDWPDAIIDWMRRMKRM